MTFKHDRLERGLSVVICCYNSERRIGTTLKYLAAQKNVDFPMEIILVNNASTDSTVETAQKEWLSLRAPWDLTIINESSPGLMNARIAGIAATKYEYLVFCDDDNFLFEGYVCSAFEYLTKNPDVGAVGGEGIVVADSKVPEWFRYFSNFYACFPQRNPHLLYGAGIVIRTELLRLVLCCHPSFFLVGRSGAGLSGGDDHELCYFLKWTGYKIAFFEELKFLHYMPPARLEQAYLKKIIQSAGASGALLWAYEDTWLAWTIPYRLLRLMLGFPKKILKGIRSPSMLIFFLQAHLAYTKGTVLGLLLGAGTMLEMRRQYRWIRQVLLANKKKVLFGNWVG